MTKKRKFAKMPTSAIGRNADAWRQKGHPRALQLLVKLSPNMVAELVTATIANATKISRQNMLRLFQKSFIADVAAPTEVRRVLGSEGVS
tara:strand:- start:750 stop:1019 length:270 start_codon:yes stop_codon:yes gene_type:complete